MIEKAPLVKHDRFTKYAQKIQRDADHKHYTTGKGFDDIKAQLKAEGWQPKAEIERFGLIMKQVGKDEFLKAGWKSPEEYNRLRAECTALRREVSDG